MTETTEDPRLVAYLEGLFLVLNDLEKATKRDNEAMLLIGSLADRLCTDAGQATWPEVKAALSDAESQRLIDTFSREIEESGSKGEIKTAYAMQAVATSLVGARYDDQRVTSGVEILDDMIAACRNFFRANAPKAN